MASAPSSKPTRWIALLRGINVGGHRKLPMAELRALAQSLGWSDATTYVQSGNLVFGAMGGAAELNRTLAEAIADRFGFDVPVAVCSREDWARYAQGGAFPEAEAARPKALHIGLPARHGVKVTAAMAQALAPYCVKGERALAKHGALWVDFEGGISGTKVTPAVLDRVVGAPVTMRNWNTVQALAALAAKP
ncbi:MAG: DUF1697 domain-containing protein [Planctomycetota bacterium]